MTDSGFWSRLRRARLVRVLAVYVGASWALLQAVELFQDGLSLPDWVMPVALILLVIGFVIVLATAWIQSHPLMEAREAAEEVPGDWELALPEVKRSLTSGRLPHPNWARALVGGALAFSLLFGIAGVYVVFRDREDGFRPAELFSGESAPAIAVLPFRVSGGEVAEWEEGMVDLLSTGLDGAAGLRAVDSRTILSQWDRQVGRGVLPDLAMSLGVAESIGARFALEGSVVSTGAAVRLVSQVYDLAEGVRLGTAQVDGSLESPHELVDQLSFEVLRILLGGEARDLPAVDLEAVTTSSTAALREYLQGERHYRQGRYEDAAESYERAVAIDSTFALAHYRLFLTVGWVGLSGTPAQRRHWDNAMAYVDRLPERERLMVSGTYNMTRSERDPAELETSLERVVELHPYDAEAWYLLAETYWHEENLIMPPEEVEALFARAIELDPSFAPYRIHHVEYAFTLHGDSALAARRVAEYRDVTQPDDASVRGFTLAMDLAFGDSLTREAALERLFGAASEDGPGDVIHLLQHPGHLAVREQIARRALEASVDDSALVLEVLARALFNQGKIEEALDLMARPAVERWRRCALFVFRVTELPAYADRVRAALPAGPGAEAWDPVERGLDAFCGAALASELGIREAFEEARARLARAMEEASALEDLPGAADLRTFAALPDAYWEWRQEGASEENASALEAGRSFGFPPAYIMGELYEELGRPQDAEAAYRTDGFTSASSWYRLAHLHDGLGDTARARDAWERVLLAWEDADPALQPRVDEARQRLTDLRRASSR